MKTGMYNLEGNMVEYEGGEYGFDIDANADVPMGLIDALGEWICTLDEYYGYGVGATDEE